MGEGGDHLCAHVMFILDEIGDAKSIMSEHNQTFDTYNHAGTQIAISVATKDESVD